MNQTLTNATHLSHPMTDIRDIKPLQSMPSIDWRMVGMTAGTVVLVIVLAWLCWRRWKKRTTQEIVTPPLPAHEQACRDLDLLASMDDLGDKPYYFRLSHILRTYLESRFGIRALEMTTEELLPALEKTGMEQKGIRSVKNFCATGDLVKYADSRQDENKRHNDLTMVRELVDTTRERVPEEPAPRPDS
ncbi:hypothetical protein [Desulfoplanes sp.]